MNARTPRPFAVLGFSSTHDALDAERVLVESGVEAVPIPAPRTITAQCGIAVRIPVEQEGRAGDLLRRAGIEPAARTVMEDV